MADDERAYVQWIYRCYRLLSEEQRRKWLDFYEKWFKHGKHYG